MHYILPPEERDPKSLDDSAFLVRHTKSMISLYLQGKQDLTQTVAELCDNIALGLEKDIAVSMIEQSIRGVDSEGQLRLKSLLYAFSSPNP